MCFQCVPAQPALQRPPLAAAGPAGSRLKPVSGSACEEGCPAAGCGVGEGSGAFPEEGMTKNRLPFLAMAGGEATGSGPSELHN